MSTALDFIKSAMHKGGILSKTESPSSDEAVDALETMNDMLGSWANDSLTVPYRTLENFTLVAGTANYTIGSGGTFNTVRPTNIVSCYVRDGNEDSNVFTIGEDDYAKIASKSDAGTPEYLCYNMAYPLGIIRFFPTPNQALSIYLLSEKKIGNYALTDTVSLPEGWARAIKNNLAVELCGEYGVAVPNEVTAVAADALSKIKLAVARNTPLDAALLSSGGNIYTGYND